MAFTKIVSPGIDTTGSYTVQELNTVGVMTAGTVQVGSATTVHSTGIDLGSGNITSHNINSTGIITATSFVGPVSATNGTFSGNVSIGGTLTYEDVTNIDSVGIITARQGIDTDTVRGKTNNSNLAIGARASNGAFVQTITIKPDRSVGLGNITNPTSILDVRQTNTGAATEIKLFNLDQSNATTQTAALVMTPDVRANGVKIVAVKEVADMSSSANKDLALTFQTVANNTAAERLRITSDGKVGINRTPTQHPLEIQHASEPTVSLWRGSTKGAALQAQSGGTYFYSYQNAPMVFSVNSASGFTERLRITSDGRLLLGTTDAGGNNTANHLVVSNNAGANDQAGMTIRGGTSGRSQIFFSDGNSGQDEYRGMLRYDHQDNSMQFRTNAVEKLRITSGGNLELKTGEIDIQGGNKTVKTSAGFLQVGTSGSHYLSLITAGSQRLNITSGGQLNFGGDLTQTGFTANITRNSSETDILRIKGNAGNAFIRFQDSDSSSNYTLGADDGPGSDDNNFIVYDRNASAYRLVLRSDGNFGINDTNPVRRLSINNGIADEDIIRMYNDEVGINFGAWGTGSTYPREATINGTRFDSGSSPYLRIAGQGGIKFCSDLNNERMRIDSNGDAIFYGNPSIDATDLYYTNSYSTNGWSTSNWYTVVPHGLTSNSTYLVALVWDWGGSHGSPYYVATQQLYSTVNGTNGTGSENELTPMCSTHTGGTGARIRCRVLAQSGGSPAMQVNMNYTMGNSSYLKVKVWKMTFLNRS